ncbi:MAG: hypothetical protein ACK4L8_06065 [Nitrincola lacisaponensis]|uniref:hypothetical protein n=1 Tax=Nitrincola lacisaponensis TaxID=267850 RepID=UPI00391DB773
MEWVISIVVMLSLIGSIMWIRPSPRERMVSQIRLHARKLGFTVQLAQLETTRAKGQTEPEKIRVPAYRVLRHDLSGDERERWISWQIFRTENVANQGLPAGWSWKRGEYQLTDSACALIRELIERLPPEVVALESSPVHFTVYWREAGGAEQLDAIYTALQPILQAKI